MSSPRDKKRADYRVIARILQLSFGQSSPKDSMLEKISKIYAYKGGSWVLFFEGNPKHILSHVVTPPAPRARSAEFINLAK